MGYITIEPGFIDELRHKLVYETNKLRYSRYNYNKNTEIFNRLIKPVLKYYTPVISDLNPSSHYGFYRARKYVEGMNIDNLNVLSYPPKGNTVGRAGKGIILYGAENINTALFETNCKIGDKYLIGRFGLNDIQDKKFWFIGQLWQYFKTHSHISQLKDSDAVTQFYYTETENTAKMAYLDLFINEIFSNFSISEQNHDLSNLLIDFYLEKGNDLAGIIYTSNKDYLGINYAIYGDATKLCIQDDQCKLIEIIDIHSQGIITYKLLQSSTKLDEKGNLFWFDKSKNDMKQFDEYLKRSKIENQK